MFQTASYNIFMHTHTTWDQFFRKDVLPFPPYVFDPIRQARQSFMNKGMKCYADTCKNSSSILFKQLHISIIYLIRCETNLLHPTRGLHVRLAINNECSDLYNTERSEDTGAATYSTATLQQVCPSTPTDACFQPFKAQRYVPPASTANNCTFCITGFH
jgi:hypothetical protein